MIDFCKLIFYFYFSLNSIVVLSQDIIVSNDIDVKGAKIIWNYRRYW